MLIQRMIMLATTTRRTTAAVLLSSSRACGTSSRLLSATSVVPWNGASRAFSSSDGSNSNSNNDRPRWGGGARGNTNNNNNNDRPRWGGAGGGGGGRGGSSSFKIPRAQGVKKDFRRGGGRRKQEPDPAVTRAKLGKQGMLSRPNPVLRSHMIELFPGHYDDDEAKDPKASVTTNDPHNLNANYKEEDDNDEFKDIEEAMEMLQQQRDAKTARQKRWLETAKTPVRHPVIDAAGRSYGRGRRKTARARVWITPGFGHVTVNRMDFIDYFPRFSHREDILLPMVATEMAGQFDVQCRVEGGGLSGQAGAMRLGMARALVHWNPNLFRNVLKRGGFMTRDSRVVEEKKTGRVKARKRPQWNRR